MNSGHRNTEEGQVNFISDDGCIYSGWSFDDGPVCEDGLESDTFCQRPWRENPEWSGWEPRYVFKDNANRYIERQYQFCGKLKIEADCPGGAALRYPIYIDFFRQRKKWGKARKETSPQLLKAFLVPKVNLKYLFMAKNQINDGSLKEILF